MAGSPRACSSDRWSTGYMVSVRLFRYNSWPNCIDLKSSIIGRPSLTGVHTTNSISLKSMCRINTIYLTVENSGRKKSYLTHHFNLFRLIDHEILQSKYYLVRMLPRTT